MQLAMTVVNAAGVLFNPRRHYEALLIDFVCRQNRGNLMNRIANNNHKIATSHGLRTKLVWIATSLLFVYNILRRAAGNTLKFLFVEYSKRSCFLFLLIQHPR